ncbi:MAG: hypothetical protein LBN05_03425 [Oscillospiraceae bacterium]|nr:hypothetical protein [Oscillospiraceae bacterium]
MKKATQKSLAVLLAATLLLTLFTVPAFAQSEQAAPTGEPAYIGQALYDVVQWTWGFIQNAVGKVVYDRFSQTEQTREYHGAKVVEVPFDNFGGLTLGKYIFVGRGLIGSESLLEHEYGHTIQSLFLGPLYLLVIGLPSLTWAQLFADYRRENGIDYSDFYTESWADKLGKQFTMNN